MPTSQIITEGELFGWWKRVPDDLDLFGHKGLLDHDSGRAFWEDLQDRHPEHVKIHEMGESESGHKMWRSQVGNGKTHIGMMPVGHAGVEPTPYTTSAFMALERLRHPLLLQLQSFDVYCISGDLIEMNRRSMYARKLFDALWYGRREPDPTRQINGGFARPKQPDDLPGQWLEKSNPTCAAIERQWSMIAAGGHKVDVWFDGHEQTHGLGTYMKMWAKRRMLADAIPVAAQFEHIPALHALFDSDSPVRCGGMTVDTSPQWLLPGCRYTYVAATEEALASLYKGTAIGWMACEALAHRFPRASTWLMETTQYQAAYELRGQEPSISAGVGAAALLQEYRKLMERGLNAIKSHRMTGPLADIALRLKESRRWGTEPAIQRTGTVSSVELSQRNDMHPLYVIRWLGLVHEVLEQNSASLSNEERELIGDRNRPGSLWLLAHRFFEGGPASTLIPKVPPAHNVRAQLGYYEGVAQAMTLGRALDISRVTPPTPKLDGVERIARELYSEPDSLSTAVYRRWVSTQGGISAPML